MKRRFLVSVAASATLLAALPASAQTYTNNFEATSNPGALASATASSYTPAPQASRPGYVKESGNGATTNINPLFLNEGSSQGASYNYTPGANYTALVSTVPATGAAVNGMGTFVSGRIADTATGTLNSAYSPTNATYQSPVRAFSGTQSLMVSFVQNNTATTSFYRLQTVTGATNALSRPTIDLGGTVSFMVYFDTGIGTGTSFASPSTAPLAAGTSTLGVEIAVDQGSAGTSLGAYGGTSQASLYVLGSTTPAGVAGAGGATGTGSNGFATGGKAVPNGSWQKVTFNLPAENGVQILGSTARQTSGLGILNDIDFTTSGVAGQSFNVYIDDITFTAAATPAPEPSAWAVMVLGASGLLGLVVRTRRLSLMAVSHPGGVRPLPTRSGLYSQCHGSGS